jgi:hypothetical protein
MSVELINKINFIFLETVCLFEIRQNVNCNSQYKTAR